MIYSKTCEYAIRSLIYFAHHPEKDSVTAKQVSRETKVPPAYVAKIFQCLSRSGILTSRRGPRGGYVLAKEPRRVTVSDVVRILDGEHDAANGTSNGKPRRAAASAGAGARDQQRRSQRIAQTVWQCVHERLTQSLEAVTLQDLCDEVRTDAGAPLDHRHVFHI